MTHTRATATAEITAIIEAGDNASAADYDLNAIADDLYEDAGDWNITAVDPGLFWHTVASHEYAHVELDNTVFDIEIDGDMVEQQRLIIRSGSSEAVLCVAPSPDADAYDSILRGLGWEMVDNNHARRI